MVLLLLGAVLFMICLMLVALGWIFVWMCLAEFADYGLVSMLVLFVCILVCLCWFIVVIDLVEYLVLLPDGVGVVECV